MATKHGPSSIRSDVLLATIEKMGELFYTRDVSEHPDMLATHPDVQLHKHYHAFVGRRLGEIRDSRVAPKLVELRKGTARGSEWRKGGGGAHPEEQWPARREAVARPDLPGSASAVDVGPQYGGDTPFGARMRLLQSRYRANVLGVPCGTGPNPNSTSRYGNMLRHEDAMQGRNFLTPGVFRVVQERLAEGKGAVEPFRLLHNMLSSQPMCFNLFGPLVLDLGLATRLIRALLPGEVERVRDVRIEWAPEPAAEYLNDRTAFDAFVDYERPDGGRAFLAVETKLTEPFSAKHYDSEAYRRWMRGPRAPWRPEASREVDAVVHNQLWRDHLLAVALRDHARSPYAAGRLALVRHPEDADCAAVVAGYQRLLRDGDDSFFDLPIDRLVRCWREVVDGEAAEWLDAFAARYLAPGDDSVERPTLRRSAAAPPADAVRAGHLASLRQVEERDSYLRTLKMYEKELGPAGVYLRPTEKGLTVISLDHARCASMIGVGDRDTGDEYLAHLPPSSEHVAHACEGYRRKRDTLRRRSEEERFALRCIRHALEHGLQLPRGGWHFVHQEWRFATGDGGGKLDLLAVDAERAELVVIELKGSRAKLSERDREGRDALAQARHYASLLHAGRAQYYPYFERLARAMAAAHDGPLALQELRLDPDHEPRFAAWCP